MIDYVTIVKNTKEVFHNMSVKELNKFVEPKFSGNKISKAGKTLISEGVSVEEQASAFEVVNNWRAAHAFPIQSISKRLEEEFSNALVVQRLKRIDSILGKLKRFPEMSLYRMQDLGGCRVILDTVEQVYDAVTRFKQMELPCLIKREFDYLQNPKKSGYRSYHVVCLFQDPEHEAYNKNILFEVQFRTKLEHVWATAVEIMGIYTKTSLKSSLGDKNVLKFFSFMSSYYALKENTSVVPDTADTYDTICKELNTLDKKALILRKLKAISRVIVKIEEKEIEYGKLGYYVLNLEYDKHLLTIHYFRKSELAAAIYTYNEFEHSKSNNNDIVLVAADSVDIVKNAYPNYFTDIRLFVDHLENIIIDETATKEIVAF